MLPDLIAQLFSGVFAPAGTPGTIVERVSEASRKALVDRAFQQVLIESGSEPILDSIPAKAQRLLEQERVRLLPVMKAIDFRLE